MKKTFLLAMLLVACGGSNKPADSPADTETASSSSPDNSPAPSDSSSPAASASAASAATDDSSSAAPAASSAAPVAASPPPAPGFGGSDCGKCVNTKCDKPLTACNSDSSCTAQPPNLQSCTGAAKDCIGNALSVSSLTGKPQKLYGAYVKCITKASAGKACKAQCSQ
jgi:hypothetical protein